LPTCEPTSYPSSSPSSYPTLTPTPPLFFLSNLPVPVILGVVSCLLFAVLTTSFIWRLLSFKTKYNKFTYSRGSKTCWKREKEFKDDDDEELELFNQEICQKKRTLARERSATFIFIDLSFKLFSFEMSWLFFEYFN
jgi:hypothetical protein